MLPPAFGPAKQIKAKPREKEATETTKPLAKAPKRTLKKGCVPHFRELHEFTREEEVNTNPCVKISSDDNDSDNKENNVEKEAEASQISSDNNECDNEKNTVILSFRAVNENCS